MESLTCIFHLLSRLLVLIAMSYSCLAYTQTLAVEEMSGEICPQSQNGEYLSQTTVGKRISTRIQFQENSRTESSSEQQTVRASCRITFHVKPMSNQRVVRSLGTYRGSYQAGMQGQAFVSLGQRLPGLGATAYLNETVSSDSDYDEGSLRFSDVFPSGQWEELPCGEAVSFDLVLQVTARQARESRATVIQTNYLAYSLFFASCESTDTSTSPTNPG